LLFLKQLVALPAKSLALVAILNGCEILLRGENETTSQHQSTT